jgi:NADH-quinone oxidoreductase subunit G
LARLGFAIAHELFPAVSAVTGLSDEILSLAKEIAQALMSAKRPLIVSGTSLGSSSLIQAAANVAWALCDSGKPAELSFTLPECNSMGLGLMGCRRLDEASNAVKDGKTDTVIILENDLYRRADEKTVNAILNADKHVIVIDHLINQTSAKADVALPASTFAESDGTLVNNEGRAQRFYQVFTPNHDIQESWKWIRDIITASGHTEPGKWTNLDDITADMTSSLPMFKPVQEIAPRADFRIAGTKVPRQPHRYSGRTAMLANINIHEPKPPDDPDSALSFSMEGYEGQPPAPLISRYWSPGWNSVQALNKFQQEVAGPLRGGDPGKRLIEPGKTGQTSYFKDIPEAFKPRDNEWLVVPLHHIFGSEELSVLSAGIAERTPTPYLAMNPEYAARFKIAEGDTVKLSLGDTTLRLETKVISGLHTGTAGLFAGQTSSRGIALPLFSRIAKSS